MMGSRVWWAGNRRVAGDSVAAFRVAFGVAALVSVGRFLGHGWIEALYLQPERHFGYYGLEWVRPLPGWGMYAHFGALGGLALCIIAGYRCRLSAGLFCVGFTYVELIDKTTYLNHYYLMSLVSLLMAFLPMQGTWSVDGWRRKDDGGGGVPVWAIWVLRAQLGAVYFFAGVAKLNPDWLVGAQPMRIWLYQHGDMPLVGGLLQEVWAAYAMSWAGAAFDLTIAGWLLWRPARPYAYAALAAFHIGTWALFPRLGVFPWLMMGLATVFFAPDWGRQVYRRVVRRDAVGDDGAQVAKVGECGRLPGWVRVAGFGALGLFALAQVALPLRHFVYPGNVRWNEEGYRFAWRVMLSEKAGFSQFRVHDPGSGRSWVESPHDYLTPLQVERMSFQPDMIRQTARIIADDFAARGYAGVSVKADVHVAFNGRARQRLVDPDVDLARDPGGLGAKAWVMPLRLP